MRTLPVRVWLMVIALLILLVAAGVIAVQGAQVRSPSNGNHPVPPPCVAPATPQDLGNGYWSCAQAN